MKKSTRLIFENSIKLTEMHMHYESIANSRISFVWYEYLPLCNSAVQLPLFMTPKFFILTRKMKNKESWNIWLCLRFNIFCNSFVSYTLFSYTRNALFQLSSYISISFLLQVNWTKQYVTEKNGTNNGFEYCNEYTCGRKRILIRSEEFSP